MNRHTVRFLVFLFLSLGTFCVAGFLAVKTYLPVFKEVLRAGLSDALGAQVTVQGAHFELTPLPKFVLDGIEITPYGTCSHAVSAGHLFLQFSILPLFKHQVNIREFTLETPQVFALWKDGKLSLSGTGGTDCLPVTQTGAVTPDRPVADGTVPDGAVTDATVKPVGKSNDGLGHVWEVIMDSIRLHNGTVAIRSPAGDQQITNLNASLSLQHDGNALVLGAPSIAGSVGKLPFALAASRFVMDQASGAIELHDTTLSFGSEKIKVDGNWKTEGGQASVVTTGLSIKNLLSWLPKEWKTETLPVADGKITSSLRVTIQPDATIRVEGSLNAVKLVSSTRGFSLASVVLEKIVAESGQAGTFDVASNFSLDTLKIMSADGNYTSESAGGAFAYKILPKHEKVITGSLAVKAFQFQDSQTTLSDVIAQLSNITAKIDSSGSARITANVTGTHLQLTAPEVSVERLKQVSAPMEVTISSTGGYQVRGPVFCSDISGSVSGHALANLGGTVAILISAPLKQFRTKDLNALVAGQRLALQAEFSMTPEKYQLMPSTVLLGTGAIGTNFTIGRDRARQLAVQLAATNVSLADLITVSGIEMAAKPDIQLASFQASVEAKMDSLVQTAAGKGTFQLNQGGPGIERFSQKILEAVAAIPLVGIPLRSNGPKVPGVRRQLRGDFTLQDQNIRSDNLVLDDPSYTVKATGSLTFAKAVKAKADIIFLQKSFSSLGLGFNRLGALLGRAGKIDIPIRINGNLPDPDVSPDLGQLLKNNSGLPLLESVFTTTRDAGGKVVEGFLGLFGSSASNDSSSSSSKGNAAP